MGLPSDDRHRDVGSDSAGSIAGVDGGSEPAGPSDVSSSGTSNERVLDAPSRLRRAAGPIFSANGYDRSTLREIASLAETNVAAISYHFGDKMGLYRAVLREIKKDREAQFPAPPIVSGEFGGCVEALTETGDQAEGPSSSSGGSVPAMGRQSDRDVIEGLVSTLLSRMLIGDQTSWQEMLLLREMNCPTEAFPELVNDYFRPLFQQLTDTLRMILGQEVSETTVHQLALSVVGQCLYYRVAGGVLKVLLTDEQRAAHYDIVSLSRHITRVTMAAIEDFKQNPT